MSKKTIFAAVLFLFSLLVWAGDTAVFVDLGFSPDGRTYMFGQYGVQPGTLRPWADLFVVDVSSNNFVSGGRVNYVHDSVVIAGHDGSGALYRAIARNAALADRYRINYLNQGQPLYISIGTTPPSAFGESIEFRNVNNNQTFNAVLNCNTRDPAGSSFSINLEQRSGGSIRNYTVGNPNVKRQGISLYRINKVLYSSANNALIFVIETHKNNPGGTSTIRYMVETVKL